MINLNINQKLYSVDKASQVLNLGRTSIYEEIKRGNLKCKFYGNKRLITAESIEEWISNLPETSSEGGRNE